jgi:micrococcal nuclease
MYKLVISILLLFWASITPKYATCQDIATVQKIVDGDTLWVSLNSDKNNKAFRVRLIGVDTLEVDGGVKAQKDSVRLNTSNSKMKSGGIEAKNFLINKIPKGSKVQIKYDRVKFDQYGRTLGYIYSQNGEFINKSLIKNGLAGLLIYSPNDSKAQELQNALEDAKKNKIGLWGKGLTLTERWKK